MTSDVHVFLFQQYYWKIKRVNELTAGVMASWNSVPKEAIFHVLGWLACISWAVSGFPQIILNFRRKSVVGLSLDFQLINLTKFSCSLIYNASLFFSSTVQNQYFQKYGYDQLIPVAANDVAFSLQAVILTMVVFFQIAIYDRGSQKFSKTTLAIVSVVLLFAVVCFFISLPGQSWFWLISIFNSIQVCLTFIKYFPQALMNYVRKSTRGFSMGGILLDFSGGVLNFAQMAVQSIDQGSWVNFFGNMGKVLICLVTILYDSVFIFQHYALYRDNKACSSTKVHEKITEPLLDEQIKKQPNVPTQQASIQHV